MPYRTEEEMKKSPELAWEGAWLSFRPSAGQKALTAALGQRVMGDYTSRRLGLCTSRAPMKSKESHITSSQGPEKPLGRHYFRDFIGGMGVGLFIAWAGCSRSDISRVLRSTRKRIVSTVST